MASLAEIYDWFMTGKKPTQAQFWASWGSFWHKDEDIPQSAIAELTTVLAAKAEQQQFNSHKTDNNAHADLFAPPAFGTFKWIMRGSDHAGTAPIAGDIFAGMITATEFSSCMIWNGIGAKDNTNLENFTILTSIEMQ